MIRLLGHPTKKCHPVHKIPSHQPVEAQGPLPRWFFMDGHGETNPFFRYRFGSSSNYLTINLVVFPRAPFEKYAQVTMDHLPTNRGKMVLKKKTLKPPPSKIIQQTHSSH